MELKSNRKWIAAALLLLAVTVALFKMYYDHVSFVNKEVSDGYLKEVVFHASEEVDRRIEADLEFLSALSALVSAEQNIPLADAVMSAAGMADKMECKRIGVALYATGEGVTSAGSVVDCSKYSFFRAALTGKWSAGSGGVSGMELDGDGAYVFVCSVPYYVAGEEVGVMYAVRAAEEFAGSLYTEIFGGEGYGMIVDSAGTVLLSSNADSNIFTMDSANWEYYSAKVRSLISPQIEENRRSGEPWISELSGQTFVFAPLTVNGWYAAAVLPDEYVGAYGGRILLISIAFCGVLVLIMAVFCTLVLVDRRKRQNELVFAMLNDPLTGLYNRQGFVRRMREILAASPEEQEYAVVDLGLSRFENFNALYGYQRGDSTLHQIGSLIQSECDPDSECCARLDGTRFSLLLRCGTAATLARRLGEINLMIAMTAPDAAIRTSYGVYRVTDKSAPEELLIDRSYAARNLSPDKRSGAVAFYDYRIHDAEIEDSEMLATMEKAIAEHQFVVLYQPKYRCDERRLAGAEALVRWALPEGKTKPPDRYITLFEENGLIVKLDFYVLDDVCRAMRAQLDAGLKPQPVSVNLSRVHLYDRGTVEKLTAVMDKYGIARDRIEFEMTESIMTGNLELFAEFVDKLHLAGLRVSMDDFGSGYSSLNMLKRIHIDELKLDKLFLDEFDEKERARKVITGILDMANALGVTTVAEGVETVDQLLFLRRSGCTLAQGYYFSRPVPEAEYNALLESETGSFYK